MQRRNAHVLIIIPFFKPNVGGVETRFDNICDWLSNKGFKVTVLTYQPITTSNVRGKLYEKKANIEIFRLWWPGFDIFHKLQNNPFFQILYTASGLLTISFFYLLLHKGKVDIIHAPGFNSALVAKLLWLVFRRKWVMSTHAIYDFGRNSVISKAIRWILSDAYKVIAVSKLSKQELINIGIPEEKIVIHTAWVNQDIFKSLDKNRAKEILKLDDRFTVLFVGRLRKIKGVRLLLEVAADMPDKNFVFVGEGPLEKEVAQKSKLLSNTFFFGKVPNNELPQHYNAADVAMMPSLYREPFGRVIAESLSCGIPVICSELAGIADSLDSNISEITLPNIDAIKAAIERMRTRLKSEKEISSECREFAVNNFSDRNMKTLLEGYGLYET